MSPPYLRFQAGGESLLFGGPSKGPSSMVFSLAEGMLTLPPASAYTVTVTPGGIPGVFVRIAGDRCIRALVRRVVFHGNRQNRRH